ncbi:hypothetical protein ACS0TY_001892 [Phlomoides rotata]
MKTFAITKAAARRAEIKQLQSNLEQSKNSTVDIWADSISLQPFAQEEWKSHQDESIAKRINSVMSRYRGQLFHWDVVNENLHFSFFESKLGGSISTTFYKQASRIDRRTTPFLNDYNTIEDSRDGNASPSKYLQKIAQLRRKWYKGPLGIGLEGHFSISPNLAYIRSAIDIIASVKLPIWVTELDVISGPNQNASIGIAGQEEEVAGNRWGKKPEEPPPSEIAGKKKTESLGLNENRQLF